MKKTLIISAVNILVIGAVYFMFFSENGADYVLRFDTVSKGEITVNVTATGTLNAVTTVQVGTQVSGVISKLYADFNSIVKEGQLIAQIDPTFLQQAVRDAEASLERVKAQFDENNRAGDRVRALYEKRLESQVNYDAALTALSSSKASVKQAEAQLERARINLAYATIYAPISGVVINRQVSVGQTVAASFSSPTLFTIANDLSKMQVEATVDESDIGLVNVGQTCTFTVDAFADNVFEGVVSQIRLSPQIIQNVVNYTVIIDVDNRDLKLMPGMTATVKILVAQKKDVLKVSNTALRFQPPEALTDTARITEMRRQTFSDLGGERGDFRNFNPAAKADAGSAQNESRTMRDSGLGADAQSGPSGFRGGNFPDNIDRERIMAIRDSIQSARGGNLSRDELRQEMQKYFAKSSRKKTDKQLTDKYKPENTGSNKFTIVSAFPQYQKSYYSLQDKTGRGRIWTKNADGKLDPLFVRTGLNDGRFTEIISDKIAEGQQIVIGAISNNADAGQSARSPLMGSQQQMMGSGRPR